VSNEITFVLYSFSVHLDERRFQHLDLRTKNDCLVCALVDILKCLAALEKPGLSYLICKKA